MDEALNPTKLPSTLTGRLPGAILCWCLHFWLMFMAGSSHVSADDWLAWRGGSKHGVNGTAVGPITWSRSENISWAQEIPGKGHSSPVIASDRIYLTTAYLSDDTAEKNRVWGLARIALLSLTIMLSVGSVFRSSETTGRGLRAIEFVVNCAMAAVLLLILCLEVFGESGLDYDRCVIRSWLGSSLTVTLCLAVASYRLRPSSSMVLVVGVVSALFGAGIVFGVPSREHALRGGMLAANAGVVITVAMFPAVIGMMCIVNYLFARVAPARRTFRVLTHFFITVVFVAWGIRFMYSLSRTPDQFTHSIVQETSNTFLILGASLMVLLGAVMFLWGLTAHGMSSSTPASFRVFVLSAAAIGVLLMTLSIAMHYAIQWSPYLTYHLAKSRVTLTSVSFSRSEIACVIVCVLSAVIFLRRFPTRAMSTGRLCAVMIAVFAFVSRNYISTNQALVRAIVSIAAESGEVLWIANAFEGPEGPLHKDNSAATPTPAIWGERVYAVFSTGVVCSDLNGRIQWKNNDITFSSAYGLGASPAASDGMVVIANLMPKEGFVVGLDGATGLPRWRHDIESVPSNISGNSRTPCIAELRGRKTVIIWDYEEIMGLDLFTGERLWSYDVGGGGGDMVSSVVCDNQRVYCLAADVITALDVTSLGSDADPVLWESTGRGPNITSPVVCNGLVFFVSDSGMASCLDAETGKRVWRERLSGQYFASPIAIGKYVYFCNQEGLTTVIRAADSFDPVAANDYHDETLASFAVTGDGVVFRTSTSLVRISGGEIAGSEHEREGKDP
jgi:outer membrane protein assembly factor BamB